MTEVPAAPRPTTQHPVGLRARPARDYLAGAALAALLLGCSGPADAGPTTSATTTGASATAAPSPSTATSDATCTVAYTVTNEWEGQYQADLVVTVLATPRTTWTLGWSFADGQVVDQIWNGAVTQDGAAVSVTPAEHNSDLAVGESASFGFIASWKGANTAPTAFTLDGEACAGPAGSGTTDPGASATPAAATVFYASPTTQASAAAQAATGETRTLLDKIAQTPQALWIGSWTDAAQASAALADHSARAAAAGQIPLAVVYAIPGRDCGNHSAGGVATSEYAAWIDTVAAGISGEPWIVLEPDALAQLGDCDGQGDRVAYLQYAAQKLSDAGAHVYLDAGHAAWLTPAEAARRLTLVGVDHMEGFALNTSNYQTTAASRAYGEEVSALVGGKPFVVDTSRNGAGPLGDEWCNPTGRGLGEQPRIADDGTHLAALVWVKAPGESDGACNGGPAAGQWWQDGALELARNASW